MITVQLTGVQKAVQDMKLDINDLRQAMAESGLDMEGDAKQICTDMEAVDTGRLRASISTALDGESAKGVDYVIPPRKDPGAIAVLRLGSSVEYATYVIHNTQKTIGRDFLTPAVYRNLAGLQARIKSKIKS